MNELIKESKETSQVRNGIGISIGNFKDDISSLGKQIEVLDNIGQSKQNLLNQHYFGLGISDAMDIKDDLKERQTIKDNNPLSVKSFTNRGLSWNIAYMDSMLRKEPYLLNAINYKSTRVLSNGIDLNIRDDKDGDNAQVFINDVLEMKHRKPLLNWAFLGIGHGGSGALIVTNKGINKDELLKPLTTKDIKKGDEIYLRPLTRLYQIQPYYGITKDVYINKIGSDEGIYDSTELGKPKYYKISISGDMFGKVNDLYSFDGVGQNTYIVHRSRLLIFNGSELSWVERRIEQYFGMSIVEKALDGIKAYKQTIDELIKLLKRSNIPVVYIDDLSRIGRTGEIGMNKIDETLISIEYALRLGDTVVLGKDDKLEYIMANFSSLSEQLLDRKRELASILQVRPSVLFAEKDDLEENTFDFDDKNIQETQIRPAYMQLIPLEYKAKYGKEIPEYSFTFKSLEQVTEKEKIDKLKVASEIIIDLFTNNIITVSMAKQILIGASDNVNDMLYELNNASKDLKEDELKKFKDFQMEVANELQTAAIKAQGEKTNTYNMAESQVKGRLEGGNPKTTKKNNLDL